MKNFFIYYFWYYKFLILINIKRLSDKTDKDKLITSAMLWALREHHKVGQKYDKKYPYFFHLIHVMNTVDRFSYILDGDVEVYLGALFHDTIEDIHKYTYNDIKKLWGENVANIVYACTELRGRNRKERHGPLYFRTLRENPKGAFVKICDVIANMETGKSTGNSMFHKYKKEYPGFKSELYHKDYDPLFQYIENNILENGTGN